MSPIYPPYVRKTLLGLTPLLAGLFVYPAYEKGEISLLLLIVGMFTGFVLLFFPLDRVQRYSWRLHEEEKKGLADLRSLFLNAFLQASCAVGGMAWLFVVPAIAKRLGLFSPMRGICTIFVNWNWIHAAVAGSSVVLLTIVVVMHGRRRVQISARSSIRDGAELVP